jgi:hypothetical protein
MAMGYWLDGRGSVPGRGTRFFHLHSVGAGSGAHPASYPTGTGGSFLEGKAAVVCHLYSVPRSRMVELYLHSPISLNGMVLNYIIK